MTEQPTTAVLRALLLTDLVDSTKLVSRLGDERAFALATRHDRVARDLLVRHNGREIDKTDGFLLLFERPVDAVAYALDYHRAMVALGAATGEHLTSRAGIHLGEVFLRENTPEDVARGAKPIEVEGLAKPVAARLMSLAQGTQTLLTRGAFDLARRAAVGTGELPAEVRWRAHGAYVLKGVDEPLEVFEAGEEGRSPLTAPPDSEKARRAAGDSTIIGWRPAPGQEIPQRPNWTLREKLGEGGYGEVWLAEHRKTHDRLVFKFCFEAERLKGLKREVLLFRLLKEALGDRDDIARVRDWSFERAPYFLEVDYTAGGSLLDWAGRRGGIADVPIAERIDLLAQVAEALSAAHSVGVLHKDLKPGNILVEEMANGRLQAKLTDFGIGMITDTSRLAELGITSVGATELSRSHSTSTSGTVQYMAPEVVEGRPVTVQADIWALGVILYQIVVADLRRSLAQGWERDVDDELLCEDIAACVEGSPERRIASAAEVAVRLRSLEARRADLETRRLARAAEQRSARRRRIMVPAAAALGIFALAMAFQSWRVAREAARAEREAAQAREVTRFLVDIFDLAEQAKGRGDTITAREILERGAARVSRELSGEPLTQARLMDTIGLVFLRLGLPAKAEPLIRSAMDTRRMLLGAEHPDYAASLDSAGQLATRKREFTEAERLLGEALRIKERALSGRDPEVAVTLNHLAEVYRAEGRFGDARPLEERAAGILARSETAVAGRATPGPGTLRTLEVIRETALPADAVALICQAPDDTLALVQGRQGVYVVDLDGKAAPAHAPLGTDEEVIGPAGAGVVAIRSGSRVLLRNYFPGDLEAGKRYTETVVAEGVAPGELLAVDSTGTTLARLARGTLRVQRIAPAPPRPLLEVPVVAGEMQRLAVSRRFVAHLLPRELRVFSLADGRELLRRSDWEGRAQTVALDDVTSLAAVGGWFDDVLLYDLAGGRAPRKVAAGGETTGLLILPDRPTVIAAKVGRIALWRGEAAPAAEIAEPAGRFQDLRWGASGLLACDIKGRKLVNLAYRSVAVEDRGPVAGVELWSMAADPAGTKLYIGSSDGRLHRFDLATSELVSRAAHTQGLTSLVVLGDQVVTASDDKTIALWDAGRLEVVGRSKAHEFLVNFLLWEEAARTLWSTSSDRSVKAWSLPDFTEKEAIRLGDGSKSSLWIDSRRGLGVVGTWDRSFVEIERTGTAWTLRRTNPVPSFGVYSVACQPGADVLLLVGVRPAGVWAYDLQRREAFELPLPAVNLEWAVPLGRDRIAVAGENAVACYRFRREAGTLAYEVSVGYSTDIGMGIIAAALPGSARIAVGNGRGRLQLVDTAPISATVAASGRLTR